MLVDSKTANPSITCCHQAHSSRLFNTLDKVCKNVYVSKLKLLPSKNVYVSKLKLPLKRRKKGRRIFGAANRLAEIRLQALRQQAAEEARSSTLGISSCASVPCRNLVETS